MNDTAIAIRMFTELEKLARLALRLNDRRTLDALNVRLHNVNAKFVERDGKLWLSQPDPEGRYYVRPLRDLPDGIDVIVEGWAAAVAEAKRQSESVVPYDDPDRMIWRMDGDKPVELCGVWINERLFTP